MDQNITESIPTNQIEEHTILQSIGLHLLPGILGGIIYFSLAGIVQSWGYPSILAVVLAGIFILTPFELGFLYFQSRKKGQKLFGQVIKNLDPLPWKHYLIWVPVIFVGSGAIMALLGPLTTFFAGLFDWLPDYMILDLGLSRDFEIRKLILIYVLFFIFIVLLGPITEEFYFRGYLLSRLPSSLKGWGPIFHSFLFALYHFWTPWFVVTRTFALLPLVYTVKYKKNLLLGAIAHCFLNAIDFVIAFLFIVKSTS